MEKPVILCVDDDSDDRELIREVLKTTGASYELIETTNGREALNFLNAAKSSGNLPSLVILDINMPVLNGRETLAIIKSEPELESVPVVVFTTSNAERDRVFCQRFGVKLITKPPSYDGLKKVIHEILLYSSATQ